MKDQQEWLPVIATGITNESERILKGSPQISYEAAMQAAEKMFSEFGENALWFGVRTKRFFDFCGTNP